MRIIAAQWMNGLWRLGQISFNCQHGASPIKSQYSTQLMEFYSIRNSTFTMDTSDSILSYPIIITNFPYQIRNKQENFGLARGNLYMLMSVKPLRVQISNISVLINNSPHASKPTPKKTPVHFSCSPSRQWIGTCQCSINLSIWSQLTPVDHDLPPSNSTA